MELDSGAHRIEFTLSVTLARSINHICTWFISAQKHNRRSHLLFDELIDFMGNSSVEWLALFFLQKSHLRPAKSAKRSVVGSALKCLRVQLFIHRQNDNVDGKKQGH
jgi:hypothetical protein